MSVNDDGTEPSPYGLPEMSLRDYFAGQAMALYGLTESEATDAVVAERCYERADAMLVVRAKRMK
jgi:hypothetical protein